VFNQLSSRLTQTIQRLRGINKLSESNIKETLGDIRRALLEADVALPVVKTFIERIQEQAFGKEVHRTIRKGYALVKIVHDELKTLLSSDDGTINLNGKTLVVVMMVGLQGSGKTTTTIKLAHLIQSHYDKKVAVVSADMYRPAAVEQLQALAQQNDVMCYHHMDLKKPLKIVEKAIDQAKKDFLDVLIVDTAGRLHIDEQMMEELSMMHSVVSAQEILLVMDSMAGQDAAQIAKQFNDQLPLTGIVLTKADGDARGGAALSMSMLTGKPIKFIGVGEKIDAIEAFHPDRMASRILGMGDIVSLVEEAERKIDKKQADKLVKKLKKGRHFDFNDFLKQLQHMDKLGGMQKLLSKLPQFSQLADMKMNQLMDEKKILKMKAIIHSMTYQERAFPAVMNGSRKRRIASGSGTSLQEVNALLKQFSKMQKKMKSLKSDDKMRKMLVQFDQLQGSLPPELAAMREKI
jgi:signal recognition particle subunit SRP54